MRVIRLLLLAAAAVSTAAHAQTTSAELQSRKAELIAQSQHEIGLGRLDEGAKLVCQAALLDTNDRNLAENCMAETRTVQKQLDKFYGFLSDGMSLANTGRFDQAESTFRRIKFGPAKAEADEWLQTRLPQMRKEAKTQFKCRCVEQWHFPE